VDQRFSQLTCVAAVYCFSFLPRSKSELFAVVKQPEGLEGPTHITLITDNANELVLHWGVSRAGEAGAAAAVRCFRHSDSDKQLCLCCSVYQLFAVDVAAALGSQQGR
jgi:hypothetical protein